MERTDRVVITSGEEACSAGSRKTFLLYSLEKDARIRAARGRRYTSAELGRLLKALRRALEKNNPGGADIYFGE